MSEKEKLLMQERLKELLHYDPETGVFTWLVRRGGVAFAGSVAGDLHGEGYMRLNIDGVRYLSHRVAYFYVVGHWPEYDIDHINGCRTDNRFCNLREASRAQNMWNVLHSSRNTSGIRGVYWHKGAKKWSAEIKVNGVKHYLGLFSDKEEARAARVAATLKYHGEFAGELRT